MPPAYKTQQDALAGLTSSFSPTTDAQRKAIADAVAQIPTAVTPESMAPQKVTDPVPVKDTPVPDTSSELQALIDTRNKQDEKPLPNETEISQLMKDVMGLTGQVSKEGARTAELEADPALQAKRQQVLDLTNQANALIAESKAIPIRIQQEAQMGGANVTKGGLAPIQTAQLRNNAIQALSVSSLLTASQGNLSLALDQVDRAVKAEFEPLKAELEAKRANLEMLMNDPAITREEKRRADIAQITLNWQQKQMDKAEADRTETKNLAVKLAGFGNVPNDVLKKIQGAKNFDEAFALASPFMQDPASKLQLENAKLDYQIKQQELAYKAKQTELLGTPTQAKLDKIEQAKKSAKVAVEVANDQVATIDGILNDPSIAFAVGPTETDRQGMLLGIPYVGGVGRSVPAIANTGKTQNFIASVDQLVSQGTLDTLLNLKKSGGTLGALSDQERIMLRSAFSKIGQWEITDPKTSKIVGYAVDEASFKRELRVIQELARKASIEASGEALDTATSEEIDTLLGNKLSDDDLLNLMQ